MIDRYSIYVLALGHLFHILWGTEEIDDWIFGFMGALGVELLIWEVIGNSPFVKKRIRDENGASGVNIGKFCGGKVELLCPLIFCHIGDSVKSILGDLSSCALGYFIGAVFLSLEMWWLSVAWIVISEVIYDSQLQFHHLLPGHLHPVPEGQPHAHHHDPHGPVREADQLAAEKKITSSGKFCLQVLDQQCENCLNSIFSIKLNIRPVSSNHYRTWTRKFIMGNFRIDIASTLTVLINLICSF